jgi:hypothetical protein
MGVDLRRKFQSSQRVYELDGKKNLDLSSEDSYSS